MDENTPHPHCKCSATSPARGEVNGGRKLERLFLLGVKPKIANAIIVLENNLPLPLRERSAGKA